MVKPAALQAAFAFFHGRFLLPLLTGGTVETARPVGPGVLEHFAAASPDDAAQEHDVLEALYELATEIAPVRRLDWPTRGAVALAAACENLAVLTDDALGAGARRRIAGWAQKLVDSAGEPETRSDALARHAVVSRFAELRRDDVTVWNWAYTYRYQGRLVPARVTAWPKLRYVRQRTRTLSFAELLESVPAELAMRRLWRELVARSPVTELVDRRIAPTFVFSRASVRVLADGVLRSGIARRIAADPEPAEQVTALGEALVALGTGAPPVALYCALALLYEVQVTTLLGRETPWPVTPRSGAVFAAVLPAVVRAKLPCGPAALAPADEKRVVELAKELERRVPGDALALVLTMADRARPPGEAPS